MNDNQPNNSNVNVMEEIINQVIANFNFNIMIDINIITYGIIKFIDDGSELELNLNNGYLTNTIDYNDIDYLIIDNNYYIMNGSRC